MVEIVGDVMRVSLRRLVDLSYPITFGTGLFPQIAEYLRSSQVGSRYAIITDSNVGPIYAGSLENALRQEGLDVNTFTFKFGERNKTMRTSEKLVNQLSRGDYGRDSAILALGGGVVGDIAGFVAAIFARNIPYIQIPTTTIAQFDSSVGGKTALDTSFAKNAVGAFYPPNAVFIDSATLQTLGNREYTSGLAEMVKYTFHWMIALFQ